MKTQQGKVEAQADTLAANRCAEPDLTLFIEEHDLGDRVEVRFAISDDIHRMAEYGMKIIHARADAFFRQEFSVIDGLALHSDEDLRRVDYELRNKGRSLFQDLLSEEMRGLFRQRGREISTVLIMTKSHHIPWEMILLPATEDGPAEFMAARYQVTRWTNGFREPCQIEVEDLLYAAPAYQKAKRLEFVADEIECLESLGHHGIKPHRVDPAHTMPLIDRLQGPFGIFHYVGHAHANGQLMAEPELELETENRQVGDTMRKVNHSLMPSHVSHLGDIWGNQRPLVFLNACQTGQTNIALSTRVSGWASRLLGSKAGAFIGTLWSVRDRGAHRFAKTFYEHLIEGKKTVGESAYLARRAVADTGDPSWLAYLVYAHPNTTVTVKKNQD